VDRTAGGIVNALFNEPAKNNTTEVCFRPKIQVNLCVYYVHDLGQIMKLYF